MKKYKNIFCLFAFLTGALILTLSACNNGNVKEEVFTIEMNSRYDYLDPFVDELLFCVTEDVDSLSFDTSFQMNCETGVLKIADNESKEVIWEKSWNENTDEQLSISLKNLSKEKEYVISLTCTKVEHVKLVMSANNSLVKALDKPNKSNK